MSTSGGASQRREMTMYKAEGRDIQMAIDHLNGEIKHNKLPKPSKDLWIAGGAVRDSILGDAIKDYDYLSNDIRETKISFRDYMGAISRFSDWSYTWEVGELFEEVEVQLLKRREGSLKKQLGAFDFTCCQVVFDGVNILVPDQSVVEDIRGRRLKGTGITTKANYTYCRVVKMLGRGWKLSEDDARFIYETVGEGGGAGGGNS